MLRNFLEKLLGPKNNDYVKLGQEDDNHPDRKEESAHIPDEGTKSLLESALKTGNLEVFKNAFKENKANLNTHIYYGVDDNLTPLLTLASISGNVEIVDFLINEDCDLKARDAKGETALFKACTNGHSKVVLLLLEANASVNEANGFGTTPLYSACSANKPDIVEILIDRGAKLEVNERGFTLLHIASIHDFDEVAKVLIKKAKLLDEIDSKKETSIFKASENGSVKTLKLLIGARANFNLADNNKETPIDIACRTHKPEIVQMLFDAGANVSTKIINQIINDSENIDLLPKKIVMKDLIKKITTPERIEERDKKLENKRQPSSDVTLAGASSASRQEVGARSPGAK